jgi:hypothetical protein
VRNDAVGFFWDDTPPPKPPKAEAEKRTPPEPVWLKPDYLPYLEEAKAFDVHVMTVEELVDAGARREELCADVEAFPNYFLICFTSMTTGHVFYLEEIDGVSKLDRNLLGWILSNFTTIGFNSLNYDMTLLYLAVAGFTPLDIKKASDQIILEDVGGHDILRKHKVKKFHCDHIDLIEVAPLQASLKTYAGRLHAPKMQDLPFGPNTVLSADQITIVRWYCVNDITNTAFLRECLREHIDLRVKLSQEYGVDVRSKSDAQIAEAIIGAELTKRMGARPKKPTIEVGTIYHYRPPPFIQYRTDLLNWALAVICHAKFIVDYSGSVAMPEEIKALNIEINGARYKMGIGGLHSSETTVAHHSDSEYIILDKDVTSYYPMIILNLGLAPHHLGAHFLDVYRGIVERRIAAKQAGNNVVADSLKIVVNGSFGKLGSKYSILYAPDLLIQTTISGQLSLLLLIERLELAGIHVVSANTDGIAVKCPRAGRHVFDAIVKQWEIDTGFGTEETVYRALYSRDVNNYIAVKEDGTTKNKGAFANPWASKKNSAERLHKNPTGTICVEAVEAYLTKGIPIEKTIRECRDIKKFVVVRTVKGGAVKIWPDQRIEYIGKSVRWYYAKDMNEDFLVYATSGNKVPRSEGAMPLMKLTDNFPLDVDFDWYVTESASILLQISAANM